MKFEASIPKLLIFITNLLYSTSIIKNRKLTQCLQPIPLDIQTSCSNFLRKAFSFKRMFIASSLQSSASSSQSFVSSHLYPDSNMQRQLSFSKPLSNPCHLNLASNRKPSVISYQARTFSLLARSSKSRILISGFCMKRTTQAYFHKIRAVFLDFRLLPSTTYFYHRVCSQLPALARLSSASVLHNLAPNTF